jgi:hypothetical protein
MNELFHYQTIAQEMIAADRERDEMLRAMDAMWHNRWALPPNVSGLKWIHKVVSSDPHDAVRAGTRVLSSVAPRITVQPLGVDEASRERAERIERALAWHFRNASRRRRASVLRDVVLSALLYDEVVAQVIHLPHQIESVKPLRARESSLSRASRFAATRDGNPQASIAADKRYGPFAIIVRNPQQVHVRYSDWMPEAVVMKKVMSISDAVSFWGEQAAGLSEAGARRPKVRIGRRPPELAYCTVYDYMDAEHRVVWALPQADAVGLAQPAGEQDAAAVEILREEHGLGFLPWAAKVGGTTLQEAGGQQRIPLLYSVYSSGQWETQNIVETLLTSEVISYAAAPRLKVEGPSDAVEVDYGQPGRMAHVPPGHALDAMAPPAMDQGLAEIARRIAERIGKSTVPRVLQTGDFPPSTAFATLNLATQSGIKALAPYKELAEDALAEIFTLMLNWAKHDGGELTAFETSRGRRGEPISLGATDLDVENLVIDVELTADVPTDRMARINAASMAVRDLGYSRERALEQIGETDAKEVMRQAEQEELDALHLELRKLSERALAEAEIAKTVRQLHGEDFVGGKLGEPETPQWQDQGFNPAMGGSPAVMANPDEVASAGRKDEG